MDIKTKITPAVVAEHGLSEEEYQIILDRLGRCLLYTSDAADE